MASNSSATALRTIRELFTAGTVGGLTDRQLLERFTANDGDGAELAFASLVERHGPMVLHACRTVLRDAHEAEDAFQATFLILALKAGSIRGQHSLASWLYSVAYNVAATARSSAARRRAHEWRAGRRRPLAIVEDARDDLGPVIHEELHRIPARYRAVLVLCYLEGLTQREAAQKLGWPIGTVQSRLARGRQRLRGRLARRGLDPSPAVLTLALSSEAPRVVLPAPLANATVRLALAMGPARALAIGAGPVAAMRLAERVARTMFVSKVLTTSVTVLLAAGVIALGAAVYAYQGARVSSPEPAKVDSTPRAGGAARPVNGKAEGELLLCAVAAETGEPIEGVSIDYWCVIGDKRQKATVTTGEDGTAVIEWDPRKRWSVDCGSPRASRARADPHPLGRPAAPVELPAMKELRFEPGTTIGGILHDEAGHPVAGATVDVHAPGDRVRRGQLRLHPGFPHDGCPGPMAAGRRSPKNLAGVGGRTNHPHYRPSDVVASRNLDSVTILKKGLAVTGRVVDAAGRPVPGARAIIGHDTWGSNSPTASTNERGEFTLENCVAGPSLITVQAEGFAPRIQDVGSTSGPHPSNSDWPRPARVLRGRVVDVQGNPVAGTNVVADTWRGHRSIQFRAETDPQGRFEWRSAPKDVVLYDLFKGRLHVHPPDAR